MANTNIELDIENITGVADANDQFIISAQKFVVASIPKDLLKWAGTDTVPGTHGGDNSPTTITLPYASSGILDVSRNGFSAEKVPSSMKGFIANSASLNFATETFPKYYVTAGNSVVVKPNPTGGETAIVNYVDHLNIDDDCDLRNAVVFHASSKEFEKLSSSQNSDVTTAVTAVNTQLDAAIVEIAEAATLVDSGVDTAIGKITTAIELANGQFDAAVLESAQAETHADDGDIATALTAINTQIDAAVSSLSSSTTAVGAANTEAAELAIQTDNSGAINTALNGMATAVAKFRADASDPALFGDDSTYNTSSSEMTRVKDALDNAKNIIDDGANSPTGDAAGDAGSYLFTEEDTELLQGALGIASSEIQRAQAHIAEWNATVQALSSEINGFGSEASARAGFSGAKAQAIQSYINVASGHSSTAAAYVNAAQGYIAEVQAYAARTQIYISTAQNRVNAGQAFIAEAQAYSNEVQARLSQVQSQSGVGASYLQAAQSYASEVQTRIGIKSEHSKNADRYYQMAQLEVSNYIKNSSEMINRTIMAQASQQG